jgi:hypothetical protein
MVLLIGNQDFGVVKKGCMVRIYTTSKDNRFNDKEYIHVVVTDIELDIMSATMEREDILAVYQMCSLSQEEEEDVIRMVDVKMKMFPRYTKSDILKLFEKIPRHENGTLSFHAMQQ